MEKRNRKLFILGWILLLIFIGFTIAVLTACGFAVLGVVQLIKRRSILLVDKSILFLGGYYIVVIVLYGFFEYWIVNCRPIIIYENLEASYPSSHTMIVLCIMSSAIMEFQRLIKNKIIKRTAIFISGVIIFITVAGRFAAGVHWVSDIAGGLLLGTALTLLYAALCGKDSGIDS